MSRSVPTEFPNVTACCKANLYFDGKVVSHSIVDAAGRKHTLGVIFPGAYTFTTQAPERMAIVAGACRVLLRGDSEWREVPAGDEFQVPGDSSFDIAVDSGITEYVCSFG